MRVYANYYDNVVFLNTCDSDSNFNELDINIELKSEIEAIGVVKIFNSYNVLDSENLEELLNKAIIEYNNFNGLDLKEVLEDGTILVLKKVILFEDEDFYSWDILKNGETIDSFIKGSRDLAEIEFFRLKNEELNLINTLNR